jgi:hypothetical protein
LAFENVVADAADSARALVWARRRQPFDLAQRHRGAPVRDGGGPSLRLVNVKGKG